jgi:hypothetical protein
MLRIGILEHLATAVAMMTGCDPPEKLQSLPDIHSSPILSNDILVVNCFLGLRLLSATDWKTFFEQISRVEKILFDDPAGIYPGMDFDTRNSYRSVIEELARHSIQSEESIAQTAIEFNCPGFACLYQCHGWLIIPIDHHRLAWVRPGIGCLDQPG